MLRLAVAITIVNVLVSAGFAIAGVLAPDFVYGSAEQFGTPVLVFALYAAARSVPLALAVIFVTVVEYGRYFWRLAPWRPLSRSAVRASG